MKYKVIVEVYVGQHDYPVTVEAANEDEARETAWTTVADNMKWDDFGSSMTITATSCEATE